MPSLRLVMSNKFLYFFFFFFFFFSTLCDGLFSSLQSLVMMKGLLDRCLNRESALDRVRAKAEQTEEELGQLHQWRSKMEKKLELSEIGRAHV